MRKKFDNITEAYLLGGTDKEIKTSAASTENNATSPGSSRNPISNRKTTLDILAAFDSGSVRK